MFLMGEDVGRYGGCLRGQQGSARRVRGERIRDTPLCESVLRRCRDRCGASDGMRPIVEVMTVNFSLLALDQIVNNAATLRHMSGGQVRASRSSCAWRLGAASSSPPSIRTASRIGTRTSPASSAFARRPCKTRTRHVARGGGRPGPGVHLREPDALRARGTTLDVEAQPAVRPGRLPCDARDRDLTSHHLRRLLCTKSLHAAEELVGTGASSAEVIDLRSLRPLDLRDPHRKCRSVLTHDIVP